MAGAELLPAVAHKQWHNAALTLEGLMRHKCCPDSWGAYARCQEGCWTYMRLIGSILNWRSELIGCRFWEIAFGGKLLMVCEMAGAELLPARLISSDTKSCAVTLEATGQLKEQRSREKWRIATVEEGVERRGIQWQRRKDGATKGPNTGV